MSTLEEEAVALFNVIEKLRRPDAEVRQAMIYDGDIVAEVETIAGGEMPWLIDVRRLFIQADDALLEFLEILTVVETKIRNEVQRLYRIGS